MMQDIQKKDPKLVAKIIDMVESGVSPDDIGKRLEEEREIAALEAVEGPPDEEKFAAEIKIIAQALAYREACDDDLIEIMALFNAAYMCEIRGPESFRTGLSAGSTAEDSAAASHDDSMAEPVSVEQFISLYKDKSYKWLVCEAPSGRGVEKDGVILGVSVYSVNGKSTKNGKNEGNLGSIRLFAVLPRFHGVCIGLRLLKKTESKMHKSGCVRSLACCPAPRKSVASWLKRRGYTYVGGSPYPFDQLQQVPKKINDDNVLLLQFLKRIEDTTANNAGADSKCSSNNAVGSGDSDAPPTVLRLAYDDDRGDASVANEFDKSIPSILDDDEDDDDKRMRLGLPYVEGKMHLPPHWRTAGAVAPTTTIDNNEMDAGSDIPLD